MLVLRVIFAVALGCLATSRAWADGSRLALLPLDAPGKLAIYGQPVAAEIARSLTAGGLDVVVVGAQMAVPREAVLVLEGSIVSARKRVRVELRLRTRDSREPLATAASSDTALESVDRAAAEVASKMLPLVAAELERRTAAPLPPQDPPALPPGSSGGVASSPPPQAERPPVLIAVAMNALSAELRPIFAERMVEAAAQLTASRGSARAVVLPEISPASVVGMIAATPGALGLGFDVRQVQVSEPGVLVGVVRARVVVAWGGKVVLDRQITTDTVVGRRKGTRAQLLELLAREVVSILRPRYVRAVAAVAPASAGPGERDVARAAR